MASYTIPLYLILFIIHGNPSMGAQISERSIPQGSQINAAGTQSWVSPSGRFAFGFYPEGEGFSIGVWLATGATRTIVWTAFRDDPPVSGGSILLTAGGSLQWIPANQGSQWKLISATPTSATSAAILDTGNFVLYDAKRQVLWSNFGSPTDTLLPGQNLPPGNQLFSSVSNNKHATGKYRLANQDDGNLVMYPIGTRDPGSAYWASDTSDRGLLLTLSLHPNGTVWLFDRNSSYTKVLFLANQSLSASTNSESYYHLTLDADGLLRLYLHVFFKQGKEPLTKIEWLVPSSTNRCGVKGVCGPNSFCQITASGETSCSCLPGFEFSSANQTTQGCWRVQTGSCTGNRSSGDIRPIATMVMVKNTSWSDLSYNIPPQTTTIEECKSICLSDCACEIAMFDTYCSKQMLPMRYGRMVQGSNTMLFVKVYSYEPKGPIRKTRSSVSVSMLISGSVLAIFSIVVLTVSVVLCKRHQLLRYTRAPQHQDTEFDEESIGIRSYSFHDLELSTDGFAQELGRGAYGTVFRGVLANSGNKVIAVKRLERMAENREREFQREVRAIARTHHRNLVCLLGICNESTYRLLVYEYMPNGSLTNLLFKPDTPLPSWSKRVAIALDVARGLQYLHEEIDVPIIHCDIKPENILIDSSGMAKIADFGLAKLLVGNQTKTFTGIRGTRGYLAPEWSKNNAITVKVDVYSFGVMLLEIISCKKSMQFKMAGEECNISEWAYECVVSGGLKEVAAGEDVDEIELERMVKIGIWCTQNEPVTRPSMKNVVLMMEGSVQVRHPPPPASYSQSLLHTGSRGEI
ncbi:G-type lectin S-receptor-like serine/threonine-protein kinase LECRK3 [Oryza brachyantha]|uniref:Receptor-like serine/threonine-protein kinase n=1 Tax=Oryza brachyantha TaxID=4533 RepID=J3MRE6_ORYBR|nr:G-type lectin S-receptor-like serine/threonine-protein kinase LECRK3 [Oryza brachyantha]